MYSEWFDEWNQADQHFIQVDLDYSNLERSLLWALDHDDKAEAIANRAQNFARTRLRIEDQQCYTYCLLLEYQNLVED